MNLYLHVIKNLPVVVIDNYYDDVSCLEIQEELDFHYSSGKFNGHNDKSGAKDLITGKSKKKNKFLYLDDLYQDRDFSNILKLNRKIFFSELSDQLESIHTFYRYIKSSTADITLIQYYENSDYYEFHTDESVITLITFFYKLPKSFHGGSLLFEDKLKVNCLYNRSVIFPSILFHSVEPIIMKQDNLQIGVGRYSITQFIKY